MKSINRLRLSNNLTFLITHITQSAFGACTVFERETDKKAVAHGLGYQLYDFAFFVRKAFGNTLQEIEAEKGDMYLSPGEIAEEMKKYKFYPDTLNAPESYFED
jgi:hypothetical protein